LNGKKQAHLDAVISKIAEQLRGNTC